MDRSRKMVEREWGGKETTASVFISSPWCCCCCTEVLVQLSWATRKCVVVLAIRLPLYQLSHRELQRPLHLALRHRPPWRLPWPFSWSGSLNIPTTMPLTQSSHWLCLHFLQTLKRPHLHFRLYFSGLLTYIFRPWSPKRLIDCLY